MDRSYDNNFRRVFHFLSISSLSLVYGLTNLSTSLALVYVSFIATVVICLDILRIEVPSFNNKLGFILRTHEVGALSGASWTTLAALIIVGLFSKPVAVLSFLYLAIGDPIASYVGIKMRKNPTVQKSFIGSAGFFLSCTLAGWLWLLSCSVESAFLVAMITAAVGAFVERYSQDVDDNFVIPLMTASVGSILI